MKLPDEKDIRPFHEIRAWTPHQWEFMSDVYRMASADPTIRQEVAGMAYEYLRTAVLGSFFLGLLTGAFMVVIILLLVLG